ncbi:cyclic nucleotide-binding domain-containing protein [Ammoniphilus resinae]|uniref:HEAT repeat protein n=1 Tax=Ammoniphilus resinae TaxID=861532 RepID=A0ABS4GQ74_9BACL|nr:HEAT repeat protein [Ammoniphilus resinae]
MLAGIETLFNLKFEDRRKVWILGTVFFLAGVSEMVNYTSFMSIFNSRVGTQSLPMMYLIEAFVLPLEGWFFSFLSQRLSKPRFMISLYTLFILIGVMNGGVLLAFQWFGWQWDGFYFLLFLTSNFVVRQQTLLMWSTAFDLCPTQQAKRVMPIFVLSAIIGGIVAGILSNKLAPIIGSDVLYILASVFLLLGLPNFLIALKQFLIPLTFKGNLEAEQHTSSMAFYLKETLRSPFLLTVIGIMTFMPAIYFLMEYQYFTVAQSVFHTEAQLTSFYGFMVILLFCAAFLLQLFAAKLIDRLGASNTIFAITLIFLGCFSLVAMFIEAEFALTFVSIGYSLTYLLLYYFAEPGYQFFFKMLPIQHRDGFRYLAQGIAASVGILLGSALSMLHSEALLSLPEQALLGAFMSVLLLVLAWIGRHLYIKELVRYLKVSGSAVKDFLNELLESMKNDHVRQTLVEQLNSPSETVQMLTIELFLSHPDPAVTNSLVQLAERSSERIRTLALDAIHPEGWRTLNPKRQETFLTDQEASVRAAAFRKLFSDRNLIGDKHRWIQTARSDVSPVVQVEALRVMEESEQLGADLRRLLGEGGESAILACEVIAERGLQEFYFDVMMCMLDPTPVVKMTAVRTIGKIGGHEAATNLTELLVGADMELRTAIEQALIDIGTLALPELTRFIPSTNDEIWRTAVTVVNAIGSDKDIQNLIVPSCVKKLLELQANHEYVRKIQAAGREEWTQLAHRRSDELTLSLLDTIWTVMIRFGDERTIPQIRQAVEDQDEEVRDHGLEILSEGLGNPKLASALLTFYQRNPYLVGVDGGHSVPSQTVKTAVDLSVTVTDPWLQAIAIKAGVAEGEWELVNNWEYLSALDKIVLLKQVPLFEEIPIEELGRVASIAKEKVYQEGEYLIKQGNPGASLFVIVEGNVEISGMNDDGIEGTISIMGPKQSVGEAALFDDRPSLVSAQVIFDYVKVLEIEGKETARLVRLYPNIGIGLLRSVGNRLRTMEHMVLKLG